MIFYGAKGYIELSCIVLSIRINQVERTYMTTKKQWFVEHCPNWLFPTFYKVKGWFSSEERVNIRKAKDGWVLYKDGIELLSPTPKFIGFGNSLFASKFERFFRIENGDIALDVGACIGDTTIPMAVKVGSKGKVIAIEPHPINVQYLKQNLSKFQNVEIVDKALWNCKKEIEFNIHSTPTGHSIIPDKERKDSIAVDADTLDNLFAEKQIDFAKIDVQGAEAEVLQGGDNFLSRIKKLVVETHSRYDPQKRTYPKVLEIIKNYDFAKVEFSMDNGIVYAWRD
jgi:FkbM family methyltransferase